MTLCHMPVPVPLPVPMSPPYPSDPVMYPQPMPAGFIVPYLPPEEPVLGELEGLNSPAVEKGVQKN